MSTKKSSTAVSMDTQKAEADDTTELVQALKNAQPQAEFTPVERGS